MAKKDLDKELELICRESVINGAYPIYFFFRETFVPPTYRCWHKVTPFKCLQNAIEKDLQAKGLLNERSQKPAQTEGMRSTSLD